MYFKITSRYNILTSAYEPYCRLVESYRNSEGRVCHKTIIQVGFMPDASPEQMNIIQKQLTLRAEGKISLFEESDPLVMQYIERLWKRIIDEKRLDLPESVLAKKEKMLYESSIEHKLVRELGAEWLSLQALEELQLPTFLQTLGWDEHKIQLTLTQIISRAVYPASELKTSKWMVENSAVCDITHYPKEKITKDKLYKNALELYKIKDKLEQHLSTRTNELFDLQDKIILYDLTNTYFEGRKVNSKLAQYGRSKEKRNDAKIIVLALVINQEGFLKYSNVFEGNTCDSKALPDMVEKLRLSTSAVSKKAVVVMDAGIATEDNLKILEEKGYYYLCVSRSKLKDYKIVEGAVEHHIQTQSKQVLTLTRVENASNTDYYVKLTSLGKVLKETGMKEQFEKRFEEELQKISQGLEKKHTVKKLHIINRRIGRQQEKYPSVSQYYSIEIASDDKTGNATKLTWKKDTEKYAQIEGKLGVYFIRTNMPVEHETTLWTIYNTIREVESTFRTLKTDLDLRPIYHKNDDATLAHLHLGLLGYWLVNTIRYKLKKGGINHDWNEIVRIGNTQKLVTTSAINGLDQQVTIIKASKPEEKLNRIYNILKYKQYTQRKLKFVVHKPPPQYQFAAQNQRFADG
jgi:Transposase DDE domain